MGIPTQTFDLQFLKGLQTKVDPKLQLHGELTELENAVFDRAGRLDKRTGYTTLSTSTTQGATITSASALAVYRDQLLLFNGIRGYTYSEGLNKWKSLGICYFTQATNQEIHQDNFQQLNPSVAYANGFEVHAYETNRVNISSYSAAYKIIDSETRAVIVDETALSNSYKKPKVFAFGSYFVLIAEDPTNGKITYYTVSSSNPSAGFGSGTDITTGFSTTTPIYDAATGTNHLFIVYVDSSNIIRWKTLTTSLTLSSEQTHSASHTWQFFSIWTDENDRVWVADCYDDGASNHVARVAVYGNSGGTALSATTIWSGSNSPGLYRITGYTGLIATASQNQANVYIEHNAASTRDISISYQYIDTSATVLYTTTAVPVWKRSVGLSAKPFILSDGTGCIPIAHESSLQTTYFIITNDGNLIAKILPGNAGGIESDKFINACPAKSTDVFLFPNTVKSAVKSETGLFFSLLAVNCTTLDCSDTVPKSTAELGENLIIAGGLVRCYDGANLFEQGFHLYPEGSSGVASNGAGLLDNDGYYRYKFVYSHLDNNGNWHRSTPSIALEVDTGATDDTITLTIPTLRITQRENVQIDVYRTTNNGSVYYKLTGVGDEVYNDTTADSVSYVDEYADSEIDANEPLYTEGEVYNSSAPNASVVDVWNNRAWLTGLENKQQIWYSKLNKTGVPTNFNDTYVITMTPHGGDIQDVQNFGDYLLVLKETAIYAISGQGFNDAGGGTDFSAPLLMSADIGSKYPGVVAETPLGLMFVSNKGIHLMGPVGAGLEPIGAPMFAYDGYTFVAAATVPNQNRCVFFTSEGVSLVYDWLAKQWGTWTSNNYSDVVDAKVWQDQVVFVKQSGTVYKEDTSIYTDNAVAINLMAGTGWYSPAGQQGYCLLHKLSVIGDYYGSHTLTVDVFFDYDENKKRTFQINAGSIIAATGDSERYQFSLRINKKCMAFRVRVRSSNDSGQALSISGLRAEVAGLNGTNRLPSIHKAV